MISKNFKKSLGMLLLALNICVCGAISAKAETTTDFNIPEFVVVIGDCGYNLDFANDPKNFDIVREAIVKGTGDIYVQTSEGNWIDNTTGKNLEKVQSDKIKIKYINNREITEPKVERPIVVAPAVVAPKVVTPVVPTGKPIYRVEPFTPTGEPFRVILASEPREYIVVKDWSVNFAPEIDFRGIEDNQVTKVGEELILDVVFADFDGDGASVEVIVDGVNFMDIPECGIYYLDNTKIGIHTVELKVTDRRGTVGESVIRHYTVVAK